MTTIILMTTIIPSEMRLSTCGQPEARERPRMRGDAYYYIICTTVSISMICLYVV